MSHLEKVLKNKNVSYLNLTFWWDFETGTVTNDVENAIRIS